MRRKNDLLIWLLAFLALAINLWIASMTLRVANRFGAVLDAADEEAKCMKHFSKARES